MQLSTRIILAFCLFLVLLLGSNCTSGSGRYGFDDRFNSLVQPYSFNLAAWEINALYRDFKQRLVDPLTDSDLNTKSVLDYFLLQKQVNDLKSRIRGIQNSHPMEQTSALELELKGMEEQAALLKPAAEQTISRQISQVLLSEGISESAFGSRFIFPPVNFTLQDPLYVLIVSPREKISRLKEITITQDITTERMESLESSVDALNVSSLVVGIGGLGATYPAFVLKNDNLKWTIDTAVHEWLHQYLAFRPLGFRYVLYLLGIDRSDIIPTLNETIVSIAAGELADLVYEKYYAPYNEPDPAPETTPPANIFDFNAAMRNIRLKVDDYLAGGQVEQAEKYMEEQRQFLFTQGYCIRKLNQAYFAFHGSYADSPASIDPIGEDLKTLRKYSGSLSEFLFVAASLTDDQSLQNILRQYQ